MLHSYVASPGKKQALLILYVKNRINMMYSSHASLLASI